MLTQPDTRETCACCRVCRLADPVTEEELGLAEIDTPGRGADEQHVVLADDGAPAGRGEHVHTDHERMFRERFWVCLALSIPVLVWSDTIQGWFDYTSPEFAGSALIWFATGRALRPVVAITDQANEISASTMHERVPVPSGDDEIAELATTMNAMLDRLESAAERQQQFVSDSSHEMRTPVAAIRSELEVALAAEASGNTPDAVAERSEPDWPTVARRVLAEDERLEQLVADLLVLARHDEGRSSPRVEVDLDDLVFAQAERRRRLPVDVSGASAARVRGSRADLDRAVGHLLDNAARHGSTGIWVTLEVDGGVARLEVADDGPGVPSGDRAQIFERFSRLEEARSRDAGGAGLGLAVVAAIAEAHHATVSVHDRDGGGAMLRLDLPAV